MAVQELCQAPGRHCLLVKSDYDIRLEGTLPKAAGIKRARSNSDSDSLVDVELPKRKRVGERPLFFSSDEEE